MKAIANTLNFYPLGRNLATCAVAGACLANLVYFNAYLARKIGPVDGALFSNFVGLMILVGLTFVRHSHPDLGIHSILKALSRRDLFFLSIVTAVTSLGIVIFANLTASAVGTHVAIPLFILFVTVFSALLEIVSGKFTGRKGMYALVVVSVVLAGYRIGAHLSKRYHETLDEIVFGRLYLSPVHF